jgi:hypothetical protein
MKKATRKAPARKGTRTTATDDIRREYDFVGGVRGKYAGQYAEGTNLILLDPELAAAASRRYAASRRCER